MVEEEATELTPSHVYNYRSTSKPVSRSTIQRPAEQTLQLNREKELHLKEEGQKAEGGCPWEGGSCACGEGRETGPCIRELTWARLIPMRLEKSEGLNSVSL